VIDSSFQQIDFLQFKDHLKKHSISQFSSDFIDELTPFNSTSKIVEEQNQIREALDLFGDFGGELPDSRNYYQFYKKLLDPYSSWLVVDFIVFAEFHKKLGEFKKLVFGDFDVNHLKTLFSNIYVLPDIVDDIFSKITNDGHVKDDASDRLREIRKEKKNVKEKIYETLNSLINGKDSEKFVQERVIKEYSNRLMLLLRPNFRQFINGIVHSISGTGMTLYVEPSNVVEMNNRYQELISLEEIEVNRILQKLLDCIKSKSYEITETVNSMKKLYYFHAIFSYVGERDYVFPNFSNKIYVEKLHHPLIYDLKKEKSVPIDFEMTEDVNVAIITGPNAGGKTAALKSIGINTVLGRCGLPLFARCAELINFDKIFTDIGDQQSLVMDLSTFTSHMVNIKHIVDNSDGGSLVLLDELGTGTEPKEGEALAISIIEYLMDRGSRVIVTTHFSGVRNMAYRYKGVVLYGVDFDYENFEPKFRLIKGLAGRSDPLIIAGKLHFNESIISRAKKILEEYSSLEILSADELNRLKLDIEKERYTLEELKRSLEIKESELLVKENELKKKLNAKEEQMLSDALSILNKVKSLKVRSMNNKEVDEIKSNIVKRMESLDIGDHIPDLKVGDMVKLSKYGKVAKILEISKNKAYVDMEGMKFTIELDKIRGEKLSVNQKKVDKEISVSAVVERSPRYEIVLVGKTVDEAWDELDKFLDKAILSGWNRVFVIHGRGSGALRKGLHNILKSDQRVKNFRIADIKEGGDAITIVELL